MDPIRPAHNTFRPGIRPDHSTLVTLRLLAHQPAWPGLRKKIRFILNNCGEWQFVSKTGSFSQSGTKFRILFAEWGTAVSFR